MLVGLLPPTSGDAMVFGKNIITDMVSFVFLDESPPPFSLYSMFDDFPCLNYLPIETRFLEEWLDVFTFVFVVVLLFERDNYLKSL